MLGSPFPIEKFVGRSVDGYELIKPIGFGAFAYVYLGRKSDGYVALKILYSESNEAKMRFAREAKVLKAVPRHENVVEYYNHGLTDDGYPFITMEFVDGITLQEGFRRKAKLDAERACEFMLQLCDAFSGLHKHGLVHRDIKPGNILINRRNEIKLIDFGLVKDAQGLLRLFEEIDILDGQDFHIELEHGLLVGTPEYLAPEQIRDVYLKDEAHAETDTYSDVYSLGLIFHQLLTGENPFPFKEDPRKRGYQKKLESYLKKRLEMQSERLPPIADVDDDLQRLLSSALKLDPRERPKDAMMFKSYIELYLREDADFEMDDEATAVVSMDHVLSQRGELLDPRSYFGAIESSAPQEHAPLPDGIASTTVSPSAAALDQTHKARERTDHGPLPKKEGTSSYLYRKPSSMPHSVKHPSSPGMAAAGSSEAITATNLPRGVDASTPTGVETGYALDGFGDEPTRVEGDDAYGINLLDRSQSQPTKRAALLRNPKVVWTLIGVLLALIVAVGLIIIFRH
ncbi:MAG: serine/threonine protein kinase [Myxococcales bacterium]|nr:serine/threonine protein kinase [Myxococcales bacterium]